MHHARSTIGAGSPKKINKEGGMIRANGYRLPDGFEDTSKERLISSEKVKGVDPCRPRFFVTNYIHFFIWNSIFGIFP